ncbi:MAG: hypothetical protein LUH14_09815 [Clostridiaceae bacterium]|nr:hypothetical protein [Clostridiaceae bacterium]
MNCQIHENMSVSEREQAEPIHRERRMAIMNSCVSSDRVRKRGVMTE